jgi:PAS domain S-box-containing protein
MNYPEHFKKDIIAKLRRAEIFKNFTEQSISDIIPELEYFKFIPDQQILEKGQKGLGLFVLLSGNVKIHNGDYTIATLTAGDSFGESALIEHSNVMASVTAMDYTEAMMLSPGQFENILKSHPGLATSILNIMMRRLSNQNESIRESEIKFRSIIQNTSDIISIVDEQGRFKYLSPAVQQILGYTPEELIGTLSIQLFVDEDKEAAISNFRDGLLKPGSTTINEFRFLKKDGNVVYLESTSTFLQYDKIINGIIFNSRDISERKRSEQLEREKELAIEKGKMKEQFLANMSHEIRTPMNAILGMTRLLLKTNINEEQLFHLNAIFKSSNNLLVIINDILDFSKIESGKMELEEIDFDLYDVIKNASEILRFKAEEKGIKLLTEISESVPQYVVGDPVRLNQIIINLGGNAVKFTEKGSVTIKVYVNNSGDKELVRFEVIDTGIGITEDKISSVFESFSQAGKDITRKYGGTGLGLSISKQLAEMHGGAIGLHSKLGVGTTFWFEIPYRIGKVPHAQKAFEISEQTIEKLKNKKILLAQDNHFNQIVAVGLMHSIVPGMQIDIAGNGQEVVSKIHSNIYDTVLMDIHMPELDGYEATEAIRNSVDERVLKTPIIAMTASGTKEEIKKCYSAGMNNFVLKPFDPAELIYKIAELTTSL